MTKERTPIQDEEDQILDLFNSLTIKIPFTTDARAINYDGFKFAIERMMDLADLQGKLDAFHASVETIRAVKS